MNVSVHREHWIGIHERISEDSWVYLSSNKPIPFTNWADGQPNDYEGVDQDCVHGTSQWGDGKCDEALYFICEKQLLA